MRPRMIVASVATLALVAVGCAGQSSVEPGPPESSATTTFGSDTGSTAAAAATPATATGDTRVSTTATTGAPPESETTTPVDDFGAAPDFVLELGEGGEFVLSAEPRPVYLVFWAEW